MKTPPVWTEAQLTKEAKTSQAIFRRERLEEPLEKWKEAFAVHQKKFNRLFDEYDISDPSTLSTKQLAALFREELDDAFRYMAGPPISADDLKVLAEASLSPNKIAADAEAAKRILATVLEALDPLRFSWVGERRPPTQPERKAAVLASAALLTAQRVATDRRNEAKDAQEAKVKDFLRSIGFTEVPAQKINTLSDAPSVGCFSGESHVGTRKADVPVRLYDKRLMPIECKVSNSALNSYKRINNDAAVKAKQWRHELGVNQVVPVAVLSGVFKVSNLIQAQKDGLTIFWAHNLQALRKFIETTKTI